MDNKLKTKTRLAAIQLVSQQLVNNQDIEIIKDDFDKYYRNTKIDKSSEKIEYNINFLSKLVSYYKKMNDEEKTTLMKELKSGSMNNKKKNVLFEKMEPFSKNNPSILIKWSHF